MTALGELLKSRGIESAVVIDDGYDAVPKASDLEGQDIWANFFADAGPTEAVLTEVFPAYPDIQPEQLQSSDQFVAALWEAKDRLSRGVAGSSLRGLPSSDRNRQNIPR